MIAVYSRAMRLPRSQGSKGEIIDKARDFVMTLCDDIGTMEPVEPYMNLSFD